MFEAGENTADAYSNCGETRVSYEVDLRYTYFGAKCFPFDVLPFMRVLRPDVHILRLYAVIYPEDIFYSRVTNVRKEA